MLRFRWTLVLTVSALFSFGLPAELRLGVLAALAVGAGVLMAVTRWGRSADDRRMTPQEVSHEIPLRALWSTKNELPAPSGRHLRPSTGI